MASTSNAQPQWGAAMGYFWRFWNLFQGYSGFIPECGKAMSSNWSIKVKIMLSLHV